MSKDISHALEGWDFDPETIGVRIIQGDDDRPKVQLRIDMGLMQMDLDGRPDGTRPHGFESLLEYYEHAAAQYREKYGNDDEFSLDGEDCANLMREGLQFYHRYLALLQVERNDLVTRDTQRNMRLFEFVCRYADSDEDKWRFDQYRPYVIMMHTRAVAGMALDRKDYREALAAMDGAIAQIEAFLEEHDLQEQEEECPELHFLRQWRKQVAGSRPVGKLERLERKLAKAVDGEQYEQAALLRDELDRLREQGEAEADGAEESESDS